MRLLWTRHCALQGKLLGNFLKEQPLAGAGSFQGKSLHFTGGDGSFEADPGVLMGKGSASGKRFTCWGEGTYQVVNPTSRQH